MIFKGSTDQIVVIRGQGLTPPHVLCTPPLSSSVFHTAGALSAPSGHLPLEGKADDTRETYYQETFGHRPIYSRRFYIFMRRTSTPHSSLLIRAELSFVIQGMARPVG